MFAGHRDLHISIAGSPKGVTAPTDTAFGPTGTIELPAFAVNDFVYLSAHWGLDIKQGTLAFPHVHWTTNGTDVNTVKWEITSTHASIAGVFGADSVQTVEVTPSGVAWTHMVDASDGFPAPNKHSTTFQVFKRITNGGTDNLDAVFAMFVDVSYESDGYGIINGVP
jgi:hypothetical protein